MCASCSTACKGHAQIAQSVEQWIENPRVPGSIPGLGTIFKNPKFARASGFFIVCYFAITPEYYCFAPHLLLAG
jgi:hypothetical protein